MMRSNVLLRFSSTFSPACRSFHISLTTAADEILPFPLESKWMFRLLSRKYQFTRLTVLKSCNSRMLLVSSPNTYYNYQRLLYQTSHWLRRTGHMGWCNTQLDRHLQRYAIWSTWNIYIPKRWKWVSHRQFFIRLGRSHTHLYFPFSISLENIHSRTHDRRRYHMDILERRYKIHSFVCGTWDFHPGAG